MQQGCGALCLPCLFTLRGRSLCQRHSDEMLPKRLLLTGQLLALKRGAPGRGQRQRARLHQLVRPSICCWAILARVLQCSSKSIVLASDSSRVSAGQGPFPSLQARWLSGVSVQQRCSGNNKCALR